MRLAAISGRIGALLILAAAIAWTPSAAAPDAEDGIATFAPDCATPKTVFTVGDSVCAVAIGTPLGPPAQRRFEWVAPDGTIFQLGPDIIFDPQTDSITIPTAGSFAQVGTWTVKTVNPSNNGFSVARFVVHDPGSYACDLSVSMFGPVQAPQGSSSTTFTLLVTNNGPSDAQNVYLKLTAANHLSTAVQQTAGPGFRNLDLGGFGAMTFAAADLPANATAAFAVVCQLSPDLPGGANISSTAIVSSSTHELFVSDNAATATTTIIQQPCNIVCPSGIMTQKAAGQCGAVVDYSTPGASGSSCGVVTCSPASGSFFPVGASNVICFGKTGSPCSFTVTVDDPRPPTLSCPADLTVTEDPPGMGLTIVRYKSPAVADDCAADNSACAPPSGSSFPVGATSVSCEVSNAAGNRAACSFTVTVESANCTLETPPNMIRSNNAGECGAAVNYPQPSTTGRCGSVKCAPPSGSVFPIGVTIVSCSSPVGSSSSFVVTIQDTQGPVITKASVNPSSLSPANRSMRDVAVDYAIADNCPGDLTCVLSVSSSEPARQTGAPLDWEIVDAHHVRLRAERTGKTSPRIYAITITCTDAGGNSSSETVRVAAPGDQR